MLEDHSRRMFKYGDCLFLDHKKTLMGGANGEIQVKRFRNSRQTIDLENCDKGYPSAETARS